MEKIVPKKSLGQHFLRSAHYVGLIADTAQIKKGDRVLEVGPGEGVLTAALLKRGAYLVAVEKDRRLIEMLNEKFANEIASGALKLIEADILHYDISKNFSKDTTYRVVANIPYYISGALFKQFLSSSHQPASMTLLVQKEVAQRIARDKKESILSLSVKAYGDPRYIKTVPKGAFSPPPKIDSAILRIENISRRNFKDSVQEERFFTLVRAGFAQKRKLLRRNLESVLGEGAGEAMEGARIALNARAEDVELSKWLQLSRF